MTAPTAVTVSVTQEHIEQGKPNDCRACAVALAIAVIIPGAREIWVTYDNSDDATSKTIALVWMGGDADLKRTFILDHDGEKFVAAVDDGFPVEPLTFTMTEVTS